MPGTASDTIWKPNRDNLAFCGNARGQALGQAKPISTDESAPLELAWTDSLTGLGNQHRFCDKVKRLLEERAGDPAPFALAFVDIDGFKPINDLFGRSAGDEILRQIAVRLRNAVGEAVTVTRLYNDVFGLLFPFVFRDADAAEQGELLIDVLSAPYDVGERSARLSASIGFSLYARGDETPERLREMAETAMYQAKRSGRGRVVVYSQRMEEEHRRLATIEQSLRRAVSAGEVEPHFQPIVDLKSRRTAGFESLARWVDRDLGRVSPAVFIPIAEERGIIGQLSQLVLRKAVEAACSWPEHMYLSFNLSPSQLYDVRTSEHVLEILEQAQFDPRRLEIEITETGVMSDPVSAEKIVDQLKAAGIRVSLDDFGTGQSSLGRLRDFRFDKVKIDRAFIAEILNDRPSEHIVKAILAMCEGLGMDVVAEGVEEEAQANRLMEFGCANGQGFLFGRPGDADSTMLYLQNAAAQQAG